ncbi:Mu-like prophage FluMu protein gp41 [Vibrio cholerae]|nr:Mu-like prophage FluMu protein gp41 [Vibrio cholerae]
MGMELLCRQVEFIGNVQGPFTIRRLIQLIFRLKEQQ